METVILRVPRVRHRFGDVGRSTIYGWVQMGLLVPQVKCGPRASGWPEDEIEAIAAARVAGASDADIRQLVISLVAARTNAPTAASAPKGPKGRLRARR